jgi:hypothetical protein
MKSHSIGSSSSSSSGHGISVHPRETKTSLIVFFKWHWKESGLAIELRTFGIMTRDDGCLLACDVFCAEMFIINEKSQQNRSSKARNVFSGGEKSTWKGTVTV